MTENARYTPGPAAGAHIEKDGEKWTLVVTRQLRHSPERVWEALTDPTQLQEWAPFDADGNLGATGARVKLTNVGAASAPVSETMVISANAPRLLEYNWGDFDLRWELEPIGGGTRLTLWINIDRRYIAMGAAGWHICLDVLDHFLQGDPIGRLVGPKAIKFGGWQRLHGEYARQFGIQDANPT